jgi:hypothetical protein
VFSLDHLVIADSPSELELRPYRKESLATPQIANMETLRMIGAFEVAHPVRRDPAQLENKQILTKRAVKRNRSPAEFLEASELQ